MNIIRPSNQRTPEQYAEYLKGYDAELTTMPPATNPHRALWDMFQILQEFGGQVELIDQDGGMEISIVKRDENNLVIDQQGIVFSEDGTFHYIGG